MDKHIFPTYKLFEINRFIHLNAETVTAAEKPDRNEANKNNLDDLFNKANQKKNQEIRSKFMGKLNQRMVKDVLEINRKKGNIDFSYRFHFKDKTVAFEKINVSEEKEKNGSKYDAEAKDPAYVTSRNKGEVTYLRLDADKTPTCPELGQILKSLASFTDELMVIGFNVMSLRNETDISKAAKGYKDIRVKLEKLLEKYKDDPEKKKELELYLGIIKGKFSDRDSTERFRTESLGDYKKHLKQFTENLVPRNKFISEYLKKYLISQFGLEAGDESYPLKVFIKNENGKREKWYVAGPYDSARPGKPGEEKTDDLVLTNADNPLIRTIFPCSDLLKNPTAVWQNAAKRANDEWKNQARGSEQLRSLDLPKGKQIACLSLSGVDGREDVVSQKTVLHNQRRSELMRANGYNVEPSDPVYTDNPVKEIEKKLAQINPDPTKEPKIKTLMISLNVHGNSENSGGGMIFGKIGEVASPKTPPELEGISIKELLGKHNMDKKAILADIANLKPELFKNPDIFKKIQKFIDDYIQYTKEDERAFASAKFYGPQLVAICRRYPKVNFFIISSACYGGDFRKSLEAAKLPNVTFVSASKPYSVTSGGISVSSDKKPEYGGDQFTMFMNYALSNLGKKLQVPKIVDGKLIRDANKKIVMEDMAIKTVGDAIYYGDIMSTYMGSFDNPESVLPGGVLVAAREDRTGSAVG